MTDMKDTKDTKDTKDYSALKDSLRENAALTERALAAALDRHDSDTESIFEAQRYSLLGGGKRVRAFLVNSVCRTLGGAMEASMPLAAAVEMVHAYSLIHDDLPCMDDDDLRRGKPSNHKVFGYAGALLAGDALLTGAFGVIADARALSDGAKVRAMSLLSSSAGDMGMIGGQVMDLNGEGKRLDFDKLLKLHSKKTGALIRCSALLGCVAAGVDTDSREAKAIADFADKIGLAFQVVDDALDATATEEQLGKSVGSDAQSQKTTFLSYYGAEEARLYARRLTNDAKDAVKDIVGGEELCLLADYLLERDR